MLRKENVGWAGSGRVGSVSTWKVVRTPVLSLGVRSVQQVCVLQILCRIVSHSFLSLAASSGRVGVVDR